jgi:membrane-associated PAP2 superfamily phosphatase
MNRTGLLTALAIAATVGLLFGVYPKLDLELAGLSFDPSRDGFVQASVQPLGLWLRDLSRLIITTVAAPAFLALAMKLVRPRRPLIVPGRAVLFMIATLALGPGILANAVLKSYWGRPRPIDVTEFGGDQHFVAWWDPRGDCPGNCSFVAGEPSGAFWTVGPALLLPPAWRAGTVALALAFGAGLGGIRMYGGGHFFTDVVFAGVFMYLLAWLTHGLLYRWRATRVCDRTIEGAIERAILPGHEALRRLIARLRIAFIRPDKES